MEDKTKLLLRLIALGVLLCLCSVIVGLNLFSLQIVGGAEYREKAERRLTRAAPVMASRGEILDRYGRPLVTNRTAFSLRIDYAFWNKEKQNDVILKLAQMVDKDGAQREQSLPISNNAPYSFTSDAGSPERKRLTKYLTNKKWGGELPADEVIKKMRKEFDVPGDYAEDAARTVIGIRYEMAQAQFSLYNSYTFASDISIDLVARIKEQHKLFEGVEIEVVPIREYKTSMASHIIGRVGPIYAEEYESLKEKGYSLNATIGKDGMEKQLEQYLKGTDGTRSVEINVSGKVTDIISSKPPQPGNNCILTLDLALQEVAEKSLASTISNIEGAKGGAAVVMDVRSGEVLVLASYPTYKLEDFNKNYKDMLKDPLKPMFNRAIAGTYAPGSTYKINSAIAGLEEGVINRNTIINDTGIYKLYKGYTPKCWIFTKTGHGHGRLNVAGAIKNSCNYYFYEVGRLLGGEKLEKYAHQFGLGDYTGIELTGEAKGSVAGPENRAKMLEANPGLNKWQGGDVLQAAIGQSDNVFTPIQICNYIATVANGGTHYSAHLLKSVKKYNYSETVMNVQPKTLNKVDIKPENLKLVLEGMNDVVSEGGTAATVFRNYPIKLGGKSGTAQIRGQQDNGLFVAFAPFDNPEIAVCVVVEGGTSGNSVAPVIRDIFDAYFLNTDEMENMPKSYTMMR